jgi:hypothetical protein
LKRAVSRERAILDTTRRCRHGRRCNGSSIKPAAAINEFGAFDLENRTTKERQRPATVRAPASNEVAVVDVDHAENIL